MNLDHFCIEILNIQLLIKQHKEFFNDNNDKVGIKSSIKHRRNANKNHHLKRQPTGKTTGKFYIRPPYFRHLNEYNCSNTQSNYSLCLNLLDSAFILYNSHQFFKFSTIFCSKILYKHICTALIRVHLSCCYATASQSIYSVTAFRGVSGEGVCLCKRRYNFRFTDWNV